MNLLEIKEKSRKFIAKNDKGIKSALDLMEKEIDINSKIQKTVAKLKTRYDDNKDKELKNSEDNSTINIKYNRIREDLLGLVDLISQEDLKKDQAKTEFQAPKDLFTIAVLPFYPDLPSCKDQNPAFKRQILENLKRKKENSSTINIVEIDNICPIDNSEAKIIGNKVNADLVIWGAFESKSNLKIRIRYVFTNEFEFDTLKYNGDTEMQPIESLEELRRGYLQEDIEYIMLWIEGINQMKRGNYYSAIDRFEVLLKLVTFYTHLGLSHERR